MNTLPSSIATARTLPELFGARLALTPDALAYRQYDRTTQGWTDWTWRQVGERADLWRNALLNEHLPAGARIATVLNSGVEYVCLDQAVLSLGLASVPLHMTDNPGNLGFILADSGAMVLVIDHPNYWADLAPIVAGLACLRRVIVMRPHNEASAPDARVVDAATWLERAPAGADTAAPVTPETLAAIVYTSGTTGQPKGVMLSHRNIISNVLAVLHRITPAADDVFLSFLPLSHTFERTGGYYLPIAAGATVAYARSVGLLMEDLAHIRPTILVSVPRIYERSYLALREALAKAGWLRRLLFGLTSYLGWQRFQALQATPPRRAPLLARLLWPMLDQLVAAKIRARFGGRLRLAVAGGAPLPEAVSHLFLAMGLNIVQGYGMTETSPVVSVNLPDHNDPSTVGEILDGVEVRIGANDEIMIKGPNVMAGYWQRPEDTHRILTPDGWLHSGDQGLIRDGRLVIKGRIKDIIVTSTGEKFSPADIEQAIIADPLFDQVMVIGEQRPYVVALAVVSRSSAEAAAATLGLTGELKDCLASERFRAHALAEIKHATAHFPRYVVPRKIWLTLEPWTVSGALLTPTLKLKRFNIATAFAAQIAALYK